MRKIDNPTSVEYNQCFHQHLKMSTNIIVSRTPKLVCVKKEYLAPTTFTEWVSEEDNIYIGARLKKYVKNPKPQNQWAISWLEYRRYEGNITDEEYMRLYEDFVRNKWWDRLEELNGKTMGCWCENQKECHGKILRKLFKERLLEKRMGGDDQDYFSFKRI